MRKVAWEPENQWQRAAVVYGISGDSAEFKKLQMEGQA
jgi:hypothetical protein